MCVYFRIYNVQTEQYIIHLQLSQLLNSFPRPILDVQDKNTISPCFPDSRWVVWSRLTHSQSVSSARLPGHGNAAPRPSLWSSVFPWSSSSHIARGLVHYVPSRVWCCRVDCFDGAFE